MMNYLDYLKSKTLQFAIALALLRIVTTVPLSQK